MIPIRSLEKLSGLSLLVSAMSLALMTVFMVPSQSEAQSCRVSTSGGVVVCAAPEDFRAR